MTETKTTGNGFPFTPAQAQGMQRSRNTFYVVWLVSPDGAREFMGVTQRPSGQGLEQVLRGEKAQARAREMPGAGSLTYWPAPGKLIFSNGWVLALGDTLIQEATQAAQA